MDRRERPAVTLAIAIAGVLAVSAALLVAEHGVDVPFSDQWILWKPFMGAEELPGAFMLQHGPHRQGAGALVMLASLTVSGWDARADSYAIVGILLLSCLAALSLKRRLFGRIDAWDVAIPALVLNLTQIETIVLLGDPGHGALPLLLLLLVCLTWLEPAGWKKTLALSILPPLLLFTGFGLVAAMIVFALLALDAVASARLRGLRAAAPELAPLIAMSIALLVFFIGYRAEPRPPAALGEMIRFALLMPARFGSIEFGRFGESAVAAGLVITMALLLVAANAALTQVRRPSDPPSRTIFALASSSLLFIALAPLGRAFQGGQFGQSSRYMTLLIPGALSLYLAMRAVSPGRMRWLLSALVVLLSIGAVIPPSLQYDQSTLWFTNARQEWRDCYLRTHDASGCAERAHLQVWVGPYDGDVQATLDYLERNQLSLFRSED